MADVDCVGGSLPGPGVPGLCPASLNRPPHAPSVSEMARAGKRHSHALLVGRRNHFRVTDRSARLNGGRCPRFCRRDQAVGKREEGVAANRAARQRKTGFLRLPDGNPAGVHTAHLARADSERAIRRGEHNGVGLDMFDQLPAKRHCRKLRLGRRPFAHDAPRLRRKAGGVRFLRQKRIGTHAAPFQRLAASRPLERLD